MRNERPLVCFHADCADGFAAAWSAWLKFGSGADYVPVQYGQDPPDVGGREVFILDFSYRAETLIAMAKEATQITLLDHHKTAEADLKRLPSLFDGSLPPTRLVYRFDLDKSGGHLAWEHFHPSESVPWLISYTQDRDLWRWKLFQSREISAFIRSWPFDFETWKTWSCSEVGSPNWGEFVGQGAAILRYQGELIESACKNAVEIELAGHQVLSVNTTVCISEICGRLANGQPFGATYFVRGDGKKVWSLRSDENGLDVSKIAKQFGGGGHPRASGFEI